MLLAIHAEKKGAYLVHTLLIASIHATSSIINTTWGQFFFFLCSAYLYTETQYG